MNGEAKKEITIDDRNTVTSASSTTSTVTKAAPHKWKLDYGMIGGHILLHSWAFYGLFTCLYDGHWRLLLLHYITGTASLVGMSAGAHRLWSHKSYKARWPMRTLLAILFTGTGQRTIFKWARDHRLHHKFSETDADPHNASRGLFFSHIGWVLCDEHPAVTAAESKIDLSDLYEDSVVMFNQKYYWPIYSVVVWIGPTLSSMWIDPRCGLILAIAVTCIRFIYVLHMTFLINSVAHLYGDRPYDTNIHPGEVRPLAPLALVGEFYHNYHHTFPNDYRASEFGWLGGQWNLSAAFIELMAKIGWAYDLKPVPADVIAARKNRTGLKAD